MNEKVVKLLTDLQHDMSEGIPVVVEGKKDREALTSSGLDGRILTLSSTSMSELVERVSCSCREVIILTDFDSFGEKAAEKLKELFFNEAVKPNLSFRRRFRKLLGLVHFEDLPSLLNQEKNQ